MQVRCIGNGFSQDPPYSLDQRVVAVDMFACISKGVRAYDNGQQNEEHTCSTRVEMCLELTLIIRVQ